MDRNDLQPTSWRPCDIANGHQLGTDGVWRPVPAKQPWYARASGIVAIVLGCLVLGVTLFAALAASNGTVSHEATCHGLNQQLQEIRVRNTEGGFIQGMDQWSSTDLDTWHSAMGRIIHLPGCDLETR